MSAKLVLLFGICSMASAAIFDIKSFYQIIGEPDTEVDFTHVDRKAIKMDGKDIYYLVGWFELKQNFGCNAYLTHNLRSFDYTIKSNNSVCDDSFNKKYMKPTTVDHSLYRTEDRPLKAGKYNLKEVENYNQLKADTDLQAGPHSIDTIFHNEKGQEVGGFRAIFNCIK